MHCLLDSKSSSAHAHQLDNQQYESKFKLAIKIFVPQNMATPKFENFKHIM